MAIIEKQVQTYWALSRKWQGRGGAPITMEELIVNLRSLIFSTHNQKLAYKVNDLLTAVINNKRCRKSKPINNVVPIGVPYKVHNASQQVVMADNEAEPVIEVAHPFERFAHVDKKQA